MVKVVVIGSGFGGLSAALYAAQQWHEVVVYEKNEQLWGRASVFEKNWFRWDMWPSRYLMPDLFESFFEDFGKKREDYLKIQKLSPSYRIYFKDTWYDFVDVYDDLEKNRETFEMIEPWSMEKLYEYLEKAKYQYEIAMKWFVPKNYDSIWDFFTLRMAIEWSKLHVFENMKKYVSRYFKTPEMQKIMSYPLVFLGTAPSDAPALYNIMSYVDFGMGVYYPKGGVNAVVQALVTMWKEYGIQYHTNSEVQKITIDDSGVATGIELAWWTSVDADRIVSNADYHRTETQLVDSARQSYPDTWRDKKTMAPSGFILYLGIKGKVEGLDHHTLIFCKDRDHNFWQIFNKWEAPDDPSIYVCCPSKTDATVAPEWDENIFILVPFPPNVEFTDEQQQEYRKKVLDVIESEIWHTFQDRIVEEKYFSVADFKSRYNSYKWSALGLAHTLRQTAIFRPNTISKKVKNLLYCGGNTNPGIGMPMCLISGKLAIERIK